MLLITRNKFMHEDFVFSDNLAAYEGMIGEEVDLYKPLTTEQENQIEVTKRRIERNFDKAFEDARDKRFQRLANILGSLPGLGGY